MRWMNFNQCKDWYNSHENCKLQRYGWTSIDLTDWNDTVFMRIVYFKNQFFDQQIEGCTSTDGRVSDNLKLHGMHSNSNQNSTYENYQAPYIQIEKCKIRAATLAQ